MDLKTYLSKLGDEQSREAFAEQCETTLGHLRNVSYGYRPCAPATAVLIEAHSGKQVRRWDLRPDDWFRIWPELVKAKGAPAIAASAA